MGSKPRGAQHAPRIPEAVLGRWRARVSGDARQQDEPHGAHGGHPAHDTPDPHGWRPESPTAYVTDELLVSGLPDQAELDALVDAAAATGVGVAVDPGAAARCRTYTDALEDPAAAAAADHWVTKVALRSPAHRPVDALEVLRALRSTGEAGADRVGLNHLLTLPSGVNGAPYWDDPGMSGTPYWDDPGISGTPYWDDPAMLGRRPVVFLGSPPSPPQPTYPVRRPVVAVLDTGVGEHAWFDDGSTTRKVVVGGVELGLKAALREPADGVSDPKTGLLDRDSGHGTFIGGIIRQVCPEAHVLSVPVMPSDGAVDEKTLVVTLNLLLARQAQAIARGRPEELIDVVSLSLGYYDESPDDALLGSVLRHSLRGLGRLGVCVVAAAGNDQTTTPFFPAAFSRADGAGTERDVVPIVSVGASNPDGSVASFSNGGDWVATHRIGVNLVSAMPPAFNGAELPRRQGRSNLDPDDFVAGFATWSGTSFSTPVLAAQLAASIARSPSVGATDAASARSRGWTAVQEATGWTRP